MNARPDTIDSLRQPVWLDDELDPAIEASVQASVAQLKTGARERDRRGASPRDEAAIVRASGLLDIAINPAHPAFSGIADPRQAAIWRWTTALSVVNRLARVDVSAAALVGYTFMHQLRVRSAGDSAVWARGVADSSTRPLLWGGANNPNGPGAVLVRVEGGYRLNGRKNFATGAQVADRIVIGENLSENGEIVGRVAFVLASDTPGISHPDDWSGIGATRSASGGIVFDNVFVPEDAVFSRAAADPNRRSLNESIGSIAFQAMFVSFLVGSAQGAIETARDFVRSRKTDAVQRSDILEVIGTAVSQASAAQALGSQAHRALGGLVADIELGTLTPERRALAADIISRAKVIAHHVSLDVTTAVFEAVGARGATFDVGLDRFWRDARTYTLHDPVAVKKQEVGLYALSGAGAVPSANS